jgi:hypothetical protein
MVFRSCCHGWEGGLNNSDTLLGLQEDPLHSLVSLLLSLPVIPDKIAFLYGVEEGFHFKAFDFSFFVLLTRDHLSFPICNHL